MRTWKIVLITLLTTITVLALGIAIIVGGFLKFKEFITDISGEESDTVYSEEIMLQHLSEKYNGQEFIISRTSLSYAFGGHPIWDCYPKGGDPETDEFFVEPEKNENGETIFRDNYFGILIREDIEAEVIETCAGMGLPMKVYSRGINCTDNKFDGTKTYADLKQAIMEGEADSCVFHIDIFLQILPLHPIEKYSIFYLFSGLSREIFHIFHSF